MKIKNMTIWAMAAVCISMFIAVSGVAVTNVDAATNTYYYMPYFHTHANNAVYCYLSNAATADATVSVTVTSSSTKPLGAANLFTMPLGTGISKMISFVGQTITFGTETKDISVDTGGTANTNTAYGAKLSFTSIGTDLNCKTMTLACFQGTTNPKRNILGYICEDDSTSGPGGNKNVLGF